jgi:succinyl-CoA synthetase alpha subunit
VSIFADAGTRLAVQGITGREGSFHTRQMLDYGTRVVAGVTPGKGGQTFEGQVPVFNTVADAVRATGANASVIYVPPMAAAAAVIEAADAGLALIVCITEGIPVMHMSRAMPFVRARGVRLIGPHCPGLITPGARTKIGIIPGNICAPGRVGLVSRSGTLTYEVVNHLTRAGIGQSTCVGIGGDPIIGTNFIDCLRAFQDDPGTEAIVMIGEIGGTDEQNAAGWGSSPARRRPRAAAWVTPARSSRAPRERPRRSWRPSRRRGSGSCAARRRWWSCCGRGWGW